MSGPHDILATGAPASGQGVTEIILGGDVLPDLETQRLLLQVIFAWNTLDYLLRLAWKRLRGVSVTHPDAVEVMKLPNHTAVIERIRKELLQKADPRASAIEALFDLIGRRKDAGKLYDRRNQALHSIFGRTKAGEEIFRRIGDEGYQQISTVTPSMLRQLAADLGNVIERLNGLVPP